VTTSPGNIAHWQTLDLRPPARQERRMVAIVRKMRVEPWLLRDTDTIRESVRTTRGGPPRQPLAASRGWRECSMAS
jgi:hypothetical protein